MKETTSIMERLSSAYLALKIFLIWGKEETSFEEKSDKIAVI